MERKIYLFITLTVIVLVPLCGQVNKTICQAFVSGNMKKWKYTIDSIETVQNKTNKEKLELINYQYGYIAWCINKDNIREAEKYIKKSEKIILQLEQKRYNLSMLYAYKAAFIGFKIGISPYKAPLIGPESKKYAKKSVDINKSNAFGYVQMGNIAYYTPKMFGGSSYDAMKYYKKALGLMEKQNNITDNNWNYLNLLTTIINAYIELEQYEAAKYFCKKALTIEPDFNWVKNELYPLVLKKTIHE